MQWPSVYSSYMALCQSMSTTSRGVRSNQMMVGKDLDAVLDSCLVAVIRCLVKVEEGSQDSSWDTAPPVESIMVGSRGNRLVTSHPQLGCGEIGAGAQFIPSFLFSPRSQPTGWYCRHFRKVILNLDDPSQNRPEICLQEDAGSH